jgi:hypothetical protein
MDTRPKSASVKHAASHTAGNAIDGSTAGKGGTLRAESSARARSVLPPGSTRPSGCCRWSTCFWNASIAATVFGPIFPSTPRAGFGAQLLFVEQILNDAYVFYSVDAVATNG